MLKVFVFITLMATIAMAVERGSLMEDPKTDCTTVLFDLEDCIPFITSGSKTKKPVKECCSGLKMVLKSNAECVCEAMEINSQMGLDFDIDRTMALPSSCRLSSSFPPIPKCDLADVPVSAPTPTPAGEAPAPPVVETPSEAPTVSGGGGRAPAPSPSRAHAPMANPLLFVVAIFALSFFH